MSTAYIGFSHYATLYIDGEVAIQNLDATFGHDPGDFDERGFINFLKKMDVTQVADEEICDLDDEGEPIPMPLDEYIAARQSFLGENIQYQSTEGIKNIDDLGRDARKVYDNLKTSFEDAQSQGVKIQKRDIRYALDEDIAGRTSITQHERNWILEELWSFFR